MTSFLHEHDFELQRPAKVQIDLTNRCNLDCAYCYNKSNALALEPELGDEEMLTVVAKVAAELDPVIVTFSGGEPLVRKALLLRAMRRLTDRGIEVWLNTNGLLAGRATAVALRDAGLARISINIESLAPDVHDALRGKRGAFDKVAASLAVLADVLGPQRISISTVVTRQNMSGVEALAAFVAEHGFGELHLLDVIPTRTGDTGLVPGADEWRAFHEQFASIRARGARINPNHALLFLGGFDRDFVFPFCMAGRLKMVICADGSIVPCNYFKERAFVCGNARTDDLLRVWTDSEVMRRFRYSLEGYESCAGCASLRKCAGGCKALSAAFEGTPFAPDPYCSRYGLNPCTATMNRDSTCSSSS